jgi:hypothetical protein
MQTEEHYLKDYSSYGVVPRKLPRDSDFLKVFQFD